MHDDADRQAEELVDAAHPFGVALGEIVVDGDDMHALAGERVEVDRQRRDQRLAFAGAHLGDGAWCSTMPPISCTSKGRMPSTRRAASRTVAKAGDQQVVERRRRWRCRARNSAVRAAQLGVGERPHLVLHGVDRLDAGPSRLDAAVVGGAEDLAGDTAETDHPMVLSIDLPGWERRTNPP